MHGKTITITAAVALLFLSTPVFSEPGSTQVPDAGRERAIIRILNLSCSGCFGKIRERLSPLDGFLGMKVSLRNRLIAVDFSPPLTFEDVTAAINEIGYQTVVLSGEKIEADPVTGNSSVDRGTPSCCQSGTPASLQAAGYLGRQFSGGCCAAIETWKQLINAMFMGTPAKTGDPNLKTDKRINQ